jgi:hypothetical protein
MLPSATGKLCLLVLLLLLLLNVALSSTQADQYDYEVSGFAEPTDGEVSHADDTHQGGSLIDDNNDIDQFDDNNDEEQHDDIDQFDADDGDQYQQEDQEQVNFDTDQDWLFVGSSPSPVALNDVVRPTKHQPINAIQCNAIPSRYVLQLISCINYMAYRPMPMACLWQWVIPAPSPHHPMA